MRVAKTTALLTVLHPEGEDLASMSLEEIAEAIDIGPWLGQATVVGTVPVPPENVAEACQLLGNDGTFFDVEGDEEERNCAHEWNQSAGEADESGTRIYCLKCGQDGDA